MKTIAATICVLVIAGASVAATGEVSVIVTPDFSVVGGGDPHQSAISHVTDSSGLSSSLSNGATVPETLPTHAGGAGSYVTTMVRWLGGQHPTAFIFDLGTSYARVDDLIFYNYQEGATTERGIASVTASYSSDGFSYSGAETLDLAATSGSDPFAGEVIGINKTNVRYVKFTDLVNHAGSASVILGFAEIRFTTTLTVLTEEGFESGSSGPNIFGVTGGNIMDSTTYTDDAVTAQIGDWFQTMYGDATLTATLDRRFSEGSRYVLEFANFRRDAGVVDGRPITAHIGYDDGSFNSLTNVQFAAVSDVTALETRTVIYDSSNSGVEIGYPVAIQFASDSGDGSAAYQAGIDNIKVSGPPPPPPKGFVMLIR
jgi:hypothetical protein